jgi:hypothetical protein
MVTRKINNSELKAWEAQQKRGFIAGRLTPAQIVMLRSVGFPLPHFSKTRVGKIILENKLSTKAKYSMYRRNHPELKLPLALEVQVIHSAWSTKPTAAEFNLMSKS